MWHKHACVPSLHTLLTVYNTSPCPCPLPVDPNSTSLTRSPTPSLLISIFKIMWIYQQALKDSQFFFFSKFLLRLVSVENQMGVRPARMSGERVPLVIKARGYSSYFCIYAIESGFVHAPLLFASIFELRESPPSFLILSFTLNSSSFSF